MKVSFSILGEPQGKGRPRFSNVCGHVKARTPEQTVLYENLIKTEYLRQVGIVKFPDDAELDVKVFAYYGIPKSDSKKKKQKKLSREVRPTKKPDCDNIFKVVADSLNGVAYRDDAQIVDSQIRKFYDEIPRVVVTIENLGGDKHEGS